MINKDTEKMLKKYEIIDLMAKGNLVRFYLGKNGEQYGDDWDDAPWDCNAERVYDEFVRGTVDICFPFPVTLLEPVSDWSSSPRCSKDDMVKRRVPCLLAVPSEIYDETPWEGFNYFVAVDGVLKIYFGDHLNGCGKYGGVIINAEEREK